MLKQKLKVLGLIAPFLILSVIGALNIAHETEAIAGSWVTAPTSGGCNWGYYSQQSDGHWLAREALWTDPTGTHKMQSWWASWSTDSTIPTGYFITGVRIKIYIKDAQLPFLWWSNLNEAIHISGFSGSISYDVEYDADNYPNGMYVYINLGTGARGNKVYVFYADNSWHHQTNDLAQDSWIIDPPVVQYYSQYSPY